MKPHLSTSQVLSLSDLGPHLLSVLDQARYSIPPSLLSLAFWGVTDISANPELLLACFVAWASVDLAEPQFPPLYDMETGHLHPLCLLWNVSSWREESFLIVGSQSEPPA